MPREVQTLIKLNKRQTEEFLKNMSSRKNEKARKRMIALAKNTKFNLVL
jgi:hypothetical protein